MRKSVKETARSVRKLRDAGILIDDITVSYTLMSDDVTRGEKPQGTPYLSRRAKFDENFYSAETGATLSVKEREGAFVFLLKTEREDLSEFGLNLPFNFMGKKNAGGWKNQYLFNSPYASENNGLIYCYFTSPGKESLMLSFDSPADGWKMDYSLFLGGHYFDNLKALANFDRAYGTGSHRKTLRLSLFACKDLEDGLAKLAERRKIPALYYGQNGGQVGSRVRIRVFGECDSVRCGRKTPRSLLQGEARLRRIAVRVGRSVPSLEKDDGFGHGRRPCVHGRESLRASMLGFGDAALYDALRGE